MFGPLSLSPLREPYSASSHLVSNIIAQSKNIVNWKMYLMLVWTIFNLPLTQSVQGLKASENWKEESVGKRPLIRVSAREFLPMVDLIQEENGRIRVEGIMGEVLRALEQSLQIDLMVMEPPDDKNGAPIGNGSWNGMIGMILRGDAEFAVGPLSYSMSRASVIDYPTPLHYDNVALMTVRPTIGSDIGAFLKPFPLVVWSLIALSLALITLLVAITEISEGSLYGFRTSSVSSKSLMWSVKTLTQEGSEWLPEKDGGRVLVGTWLLGSLVFMSCYSGILTAMLTVPKVDIPIDSLEDLVKQTKVPWRLSPGSYMANYLKESSSAVHQAVYEGSSGGFSSCWRDKESVAVGEYALICVEIEIFKIMSWDFSTNGKCRIYKARKYVLTNNMSTMVFKKNSTYLEKTRNVINQLHESGLYDHWRKSHLANVTQCLKPPSAQRTGEGVAALDFEAFGGSFLLLTAGFSISLSIFFGETLFYTCTQ